ncbi:MAG: type IV toxin-antitoxin system AbiEi family antitoxin domain-containing protein [Pseudomonadota bacterium]
MSKTTEMVRNFAAANTTIRKKQVKEALGLSVDQVANAVYNLTSQGYLKRIGHGTYLFNDYVQKTGPDINDKIWKAMKVSSGSFSAAEIARLAESTTSYVCKQFRIYRADDYLKDAGIHKTHAGWEKLFRLTQKGKEKSMNPDLEAFTPDPLIMAAVNLNRLICSGLAIRDEDAAKQALAFVEEIKNGLEDVTAPCQANRE